MWKRLILETYSSEFNELCENIFQLCKEKCSLKLNATRISICCKSQCNLTLTTTFSVTQCKAFCGETSVWKSLTVVRYDIFSQSHQIHQTAPHEELFTMETASFTSLSPLHCSGSYSHATCTHKHTLYCLFFSFSQEGTVQELYVCLCVFDSKPVICSLQNIVCLQL